MTRVSGAVVAPKILQEVRSLYLAFLLGVDLDVWCGRICLRGSTSIKCHVAVPVGVLDAWSRLPSPVGWSLAIGLSWFLVASLHV